MRVIERALREADHLRADADAPFVERFDGDLVAAPDLAQHVRPRHAAVFQQQLARAAGADAELVFLLADGEPGKAALDEKRGDAAIARVGIHGRKDDEEVGFVGVGDPELAAGQAKLAARLDRARGQARTRRCPSRLPTGHRHRRARGRELRQVLRFLVVGAPAQQRVDDQGVLHVDEHADRRVDRGQGFDGQHSVEEAGAGSAMRLGNLDAHDAQLEEPVDEGARHLRLVVHFADKGPDFARRELRGRCPETALRLPSGGSAAAGMSAAFSTARECYHSKVMNKGRLRLALRRDGCRSCGADGAWA